ncbi:MAG: LPS export ABC transporter periplasmic protein LptC [Nitrospirae bacterium]|nr:LPS export ABC transporter periplasmic protein LptC [Nitrospirota bacterium]
MKKILMAILSFTLFFMLSLMLRNDRELRRDLHLKDNSFIEGLRIVQKKDGNIIWTLTAEKADIIESKSKANLSNIIMAVEKNGLVLYTDNGIYNLSNRNFTTKGKLRAESKDYTIMTESIDWEASSGKVKTKDGIIVEGKNFKVEGTGMETNPGQKVRILKDVKATFYK